MRGTEGPAVVRSNRRAWPTDERAYDVAGEVVVVDAAQHVRDYVGRFFAPAAGSARAGLTIRVRRAGPGAVRIACFPGGPRSTNWTIPVAEETAAVRKLIRAWGLAGPDVGRRGILHAAAFVDDGRMFVVLGPPRTGKTTLLLDAVLNRRFVGLSNDALAIGNDVQPWVANVPSVIGVRSETLLSFAAPLRDLARHQVPTIGVVYDGSRYYYPDCLLTALASTRPLPGMRPPVVAVARFAMAGEPPGVRPVTRTRVRAMVAAELAAWPLGREVDVLAARLGGVSWRVVTARSMTLLDRLLDNATVVEFVHRGAVEPLLKFARTHQEATCR